MRILMLILATTALADVCTYSGPATEPCKPCESCADAKARVKAQCEAEFPGQPVMVIGTCTEDGLCHCGSPMFTCKAGHSGGGVGNPADDQPF
ncbi:MAG: hypothetical protein ABL912_02010 [Novosphingobium sp.]